MHCKHLGADQYTFGSVLYLLVYFIMGGTQQDNLDKIWKHIQGYYSSHKHLTRYTAMKLTMFKKPKDEGPKLRGKAAQVKSFCEPCLSAWLKFSGATNASGGTADAMLCNITTLLRANCKIEQLMSNNKFKYAFSKDDATTLKQAMFSMLQLQTTVAHHYATVEKIKVFTVTTKSHFLAHLALQAHVINPAVCWCYKGEDFMQCMRTLTENCIRGNSVTTVSHKIASHYRLALHFEALRIVQYTDY